MCHTIVLFIACNIFAPSGGCNVTSPVKPNNTDENCTKVVYDVELYLVNDDFLKKQKAAVDLLQHNIELQEKFKLIEQVRFRKLPHQFHENCCKIYHETVDQIRALQTEYKAIFEDIYKLEIKLLHDGIDCETALKNIQGKSDCKVDLNQVNTAHALLRSTGKKSAFESLQKIEAAFTKLQSLMYSHDPYARYVLVRKEANIQEPNAINILQGKLSPSEVRKRSALLRKSKVPGKLSSQQVRNSKRQTEKPTTANTVKQGHEQEVVGNGNVILSSNACAQSDKCKGAFEYYLGLEVGKNNESNELAHAK